MVTPEGRSGGVRATHRGVVLCPLSQPVSGARKTPSAASAAGGYRADRRTRRSGARAPASFDLRPGPAAGRCVTCSTSWGGRRAGRAGRGPDRCAGPGRPRRHRPRPAGHADRRGPRHRPGPRHRRLGPALPRAGGPAAAAHGARPGRRRQGGRPPGAGGQRRRRLRAGVAGGAAGRRPPGPAARGGPGLRRPAGGRADQGRPGRAHRGGRAGRGGRDRAGRAGRADQPGRRPRPGRAAGDARARPDRRAAGQIRGRAICRFSDCRHAGEPGCAIAAAVADGTLSPRRVAAHAGLRQEVGWLRDRYDARRRAERRREWKQLSKAVRAGRRASPRYGGPAPPDPPR